MTERARQWIDHIAVIRQVAGERLARHGHHHRNGWEHCPICSVPFDYSRCGWVNCPVCADPQTPPNRTETPCPQP